MNKWMGRVAALIALAGVGLSAAPAQAAPAMKIGLRVEKLNRVDQPGGFKVYIRVVVPMTQAQAQAAKDAGYRIRTSLWGEDLLSDDLMWGPVNFPLYQATPQGLEIDSFVFLSRKTMDEDADYEPYFSGDEAYLYAEYVNPAGRALQNVRSKTVHYTAF
ncbi:hypothetical protein J5X84_25935 [Streptosporangiaceae bacterium NEAU-GS5]|nr:hypothetical protein [Streptosporangiaceae bacterium NEAU-GS5]